MLRLIVLAVVGALIHFKVATGVAAVVCGAVGLSIVLLSIGDGGRLGRAAGSFYSWPGRGGGD